MNLSKVKKIFFLSLIIATVSGGAIAQNQWIDTILPPDYLLENFPSLGDDGKIESKGLFVFEDVRGVSTKENPSHDLILIFRPPVALNELDKPHSQTLAICFFDPKTQKYVKKLEDVGGIIQWVKFVAGPDKKSLNVILLRDDLKGNQVLKGFAYLGGEMKQVLDAMAPQVFAKFVTGFQGSEIWCSSKISPKEKVDAEHVFSWDEAKSQYAEGKTSTTAGWSGGSISAPATVVVAEEKSVKLVDAKPTVSQTKATHPSKNGWWDEPLDGQAASAKLNSELAPQLIKKGQIAVLGQKARALFSELQKKKVDAKSINGMRAGYYAAVASTLLDMGNKKDAAYYLKTAFSFQADNPDAVALKEKMK